ncbi:MAG TPA: HAMP domain-containing protein, partial [Streptomyces sp.]
MRPPIAALFCLLLAVAAVTVLVLGTAGGQEVPQAARDAEQQIAADAAAATRTSVESDADALRRAATTYSLTTKTTPAMALKALLPVNSSARGAALLDPHSGSQLAATGEPLPLAGVDVVAQDRDSHGGPIAARLTSADGAAPRLLLFARITLPTTGDAQDANQDQGQDVKGKVTAQSRWLLVVSETLTVPTVYGDGRTARLVNRDGRVLGSTHAPFTAAHPAADPNAAPGSKDAALPAGAADAANAASHVTEASGSLMGDRVGNQRTVAGWGSVAPAGGEGDTSELGLTVLTSQRVAVTAAEADHVRFALEAAGVLVVITLLVTALLTLALQRPVLRLHLSATRLARGAADDSAGPATAHAAAPAEEDDLTRPVPVAGFGEPARIGRALESLRRQLLGETGPAPAPQRRGAGTRTLVVVCALLVGAWSVPMLFLLNRADAAAVIPRTVLADQQARTQAAADRVRQSLGQRYSDLTTLAATLSGTAVDHDRTPLRRALDAHSQYRSLYVLNRRGAILLRVGDKPLRTITHTPTGSGITTVNTSGRIPSIAAYAQIPPSLANPAAPAVTDDTPVVLFGEIDVHALDRTLSRPNLGKVWLTDQQHKVLAANVGFRAFQSLPDSRLTRLAAGT